MIMIGLAGSAGSGKDTVADYLVQQYGFTKFSFSDPLYREVSGAFSVTIGELQDRDLKEQPHLRLTARNCNDKAFSDLMLGYEIGLDEPMSPRWVLQRWGTEYRRAQDQDYWLKAASLWVEAWLQVTEDDGEYHAGLVNASVRFPNEQAWINAMGGTVWHVRRADRGGNASQLDHVAEQQLPMGDKDREITNNGTVEELNTAVSLLLQAPFNAGPNLPVDVNFVDTSPEPVKLVRCDACGLLHTAYTEAQAALEVKSYNYWSYSSEAEDSHINVGEASVDDYRGCNECGGGSFSLVGDDANDATDQNVIDRMIIPPVIYEEHA